MSKLVIVESPAKAKTIKKYLGKGYEVTASMGHVRDLPEKRLSVEIKKNFKPKYDIIPGKEKLVEDLKNAAAKSDEIYLATDPDREGEAISWHLAYILGLDEKEHNRVTFNEITKTGVKSGMEQPRSIDLNLVDAQQARRVLDRLVGYKLSPFISQKIRKGLSAGRVQSVAVRLIVEREEEIRAFIPEEYWTLDARFSPPGSRKIFPASFYGDENGKIKITCKEQADGILNEIDGQEYKVSKVKKGTRRKNPAPPFITSTLQQEASRKLNFQARRTMRAAQELYEGVEVEGLGAVGLITYMRTDSLRISEEARAAGTEFIRQTYGEKYVPDKPRYYKSKNNAQDGHEAIRPSMPELTPERVKGSLSADQYKIYKLVWERFTASLMSACVQNTMQVDISVSKYFFKASGYTVKFDGYTVLYEESKDEESEEGGALPPLAEGDILKLRDIKGNQHFTQPPPRYTEASLIKALEENGIGRPSTYAATITTIVSREYVTREGKQLKPTELGEVTTKLMKERFPKVVNVKFTAQMENDLDKVEEGELQWQDAVHKFYDEFAETLAKVKKDMEGISLKLPEEETDIECELCGRKMVIKNGRFGKFLACPGYPECKNAKPILHETGAVCPKCGGNVIQKKSRKGRVFFGCSNYPNCDFVTWDEPLKDHCPKCGKSLFKKRAGVIYCPNPDCDYETKVKKKTKGEAEDE